MKKLIIGLIFLVLFSSIASAASVFDVPKLIGYWSFDEGGGSTVYNINNKNIYNFTRFTGTPLWNYGKVGPWGFIQNGSVQGDSLGNTSINPTGIGNFSWSLWMNATQVASTQCLLMHRETGFGLQDLCIRSGDLTFRVGNGSVNSQVAATIVANRTYHVVVVANSSDNLYIYINGTNIANASFTGPVKGGLAPLYVGSTTQSSEFYDGWYDEIGYWNKSLGVADVLELYRNGLGKAYPSSSIMPRLNFPSHEQGFSTQNIPFNFTVFSSANGFNITNATLFLYNSLNALVNNSNVSLTGNLSNGTTITLNNLELGTYKWNVYACGINASGTQCNVAPLNYTLYIGAMVNTNSYNATTYETSRENFYSNISIVSGASISSTSIYYGGTAYSATATSIGGNDYGLSSNVDIPLGATTNTWFWSILFSNGFQQNLSVNTQTASLINLSICAGTPQNVPFINFTFKNETSSLQDISAFISSSTFTYWLGSGSVNKTLSYSNSTELSSFGFCFNPPSKSLNVDAELSYDNAESQLRTFVQGFTLSNVSTSQVLYLLPTNDGIFGPFQTVSASGSPLGGVSASISRTIGSNTFIVASSVTDSSGFVTFFLNPDITYTATFSKDGFPSNTFSFTPTTDMRTVTMGSGGAGITNGTVVTLNTTIIITPSNLTLLNKTSYTFSLNVSSSQTITFISMNITNSSGYQLLYTSNNGAGTISGILNTGSNESFRALYTIATSSESFTILRIYTMGDTYIGPYSLYRQLLLFMSYQFATFWRMILVIVVLIVLVMFLSSNELIDSSESKVGLVVLIVWIFSFVGWLDTGYVINSTNSQVNNLAQYGSKYGIAILTTATGLYLFLRRNR